MSRSSFLDWAAGRVVVGALAVLASAPVGGVCARCADAPKGQSAVTPALAPDFVLTSLDGRVVRLSDLRGKVVLLNFWATWCAACKMETPELVDLYRRHHAQGLEIVGVSMDDGGRQQVAAFAREQGMRYTVLLGTNAVADAYGGVQFLPQTFVISRSGRIVEHALGLTDLGTLERGVVRQLAAGGS